MSVTLEQFCQMLHPNVGAVIMRFPQVALELQAENERLVSQLSVETEKLRQRDDQLITLHQAFEEERKQVDELRAQLSVETEKLKQRDDQLIAFRQSYEEERKQAAELRDQLEELRAPPKQRTVIPPPRPRTTSPTPVSMPSGSIIERAKQVCADMNEHTSSGCIRALIIALKDNRSATELPSDEQVIEVFKAIENLNTRQNRFRSYAMVYERLTGKKPSEAYIKAVKLSIDIYKANDKFRAAENITNIIKMKKNTSEDDVEKTLKKLEEALSKRERAMEKIKSPYTGTRAEKKIFRSEPIYLLIARLVTSLYKDGITLRPEDYYNTVVVEKKEDVPDDQNYVCIETGKLVIDDGKSEENSKRTIDMPKECMTAITEFRETLSKYPIRWLVPTPQNGQFEGSNFSKYFKTATGFVQRELRHTGIREQIQRGDSLEQIAASAAAAGHSVSTRLTQYTAPIAPRK